MGQTATWGASWVKEIYSDTSMEKSKVSDRVVANGGTVPWTGREVKKSNGL